MELNTAVQRSSRRGRGPAPTRRLGQGLLATTLLAALLPAAPIVAQATTSPSPFPADPDLQVMLDYLVEDGATPGIVFGIVEADGTTRVLSAGTGGPDAPALGPESVFELGSIAKTFTGTLLALAVRRGEASLDDPVADYMPDSVRIPSRGGRDITLLDLATHRSGLPSLPTNYIPGDLGDPYADLTLEVLYDFLGSYELPREPGERAEYSNLGYGLLGHALARAAGTTYRELARAKILEPLGMHSTAYASEAAYADAGMARRMTQPHSVGQPVPAWTVTEAMAGAGGLRSTVADMLKYLAANVGSPETELEEAMRDAREARASFEPRAREAARIGLAWQSIPAGGRTIVEHGGSSAGSSARIALDPERHVGYVRLTNTGGFPDDLGRYLLATGPPADDPVVDVPRAVLESYVGAYRFAQGADLFIRLDEDRGWLTSQLGRTVRFRMYPTADTSFYLKRIPARFAFRTDAAGAVSAVLNPGPRERVMPRADRETPPSRLPSPTILDRPLTAEQIERYAGTYTVEAAGRTLEVRVRGTGDRLVAELVGGATARLRFQGDHAFVPERDPRSRITFEVQDGRAVGFEMTLGGTPLTGRRVDDPRSDPRPSTPDGQAP